MRIWMWMIMWLMPTWMASQTINPFGNALVPDMIADASIQKIGDTFYCYATTDGYGQGLKTSGPPVVWKSKDFLHWSFEGTYFPSAEREKYWAPSKVVERNGRWYICPTVNGYMHMAVADKPDGPFRLIRGKDEFEKPYTKTATLLQDDKKDGIDAELFIDDDGQAYVFWGKRHVAKLGQDMMIDGEILTLETRRKEYSEGPIFFKRNGIYYYLYTIGGDEHYEYYYMMSRTSPLGPFETPKNDRVSTTNVESGVFGPGHGCVFNDGNNFYFAFLEFSRNSTNRQTYVNKMEFNDDGTIKPVEVSLDGVGALRHFDQQKELKPVAIKASSTREMHKIRHFKDDRCQRTEYFVPEFAIDGANGSRWMANDKDSACWLEIDLGKVVNIAQSELYFVRPTAGHAYVLEGSEDGTTWKTCGGHSDVLKLSPHTDNINQSYRYLRVKITDGIKGVWEWRILSDKKEVVWGNWQTFGEQADSTYRNPIIPADYSDLDCIKVGDDYYAITSTMQYSPGMTVLHSRDLVNWEIVGNAVNDLTQISPALGWQQMDRYGRGIWAGTLRYHDNRFYLYFGTPNEGYFMTSAPKAEGPWEPLTPLLLEDGWDDCTVLWDNKGQCWFVGTCFKDNYKTYRFKMSADGRSLDRKSMTLIHEGYGREANKLIYHNGYYYLIYSEHKNGIGRYVLAKRDKKISGKFVETKQLLSPCLEAHEPNQGGIIEGPDGKWYFLTHHGYGDWSGRIMSLLPVEWKDGWPMIGDMSQSELGTMMWEGVMPKKEEKKLHLQKSDDFDNLQLGPQWQWNYEPRKEMFSLNERPGWLRLKAFQPLEKANFLKVGNVITQRAFRSPNNEVIIKMDITHLTDGTHAGLAHFAQNNASLDVVNRKGKTYIEFINNNQVKQSVLIESEYVWMKSTWGLDGRSQFSYSLDGETFIPFGRYPLSWGFYRGDRIGIFCYNENVESGWVDVDYLHYHQSFNE